MIIIFTLKSVIKLPLISTQEPPKTRICELDIERIRIGMMTGKPKIAIMTELLLVLLEIEETMVNAADNPSEPTSRLMKKAEGVLTGNPRNNE